MEAIPIQPKTLLKRLQNENAILNGTLKAKEGKLESLEEKLKATNADLASLKQLYAAEIKRMQFAHSCEMLQISKDRAEELAMLSSQSEEQSQRHSSGGEGDLNGEKNRLLQQVEELRAEVKQLKHSHAEDRRNMKVEFSSKQIAQERSFRTELAEMKDKLREREDEVLAREEQLQTVQTKMANLQLVNAQLEQSKEESLHTQNKLRADLKTLQLSMAVVYKGAGSKGGDEESGLRMQEAQAEAKSRQMMNMVDFLKAQVAAEQATNKEQKEDMDGFLLTIEAVREELRTKNDEVEGIVKNAVEDAERRVEAHFMDQVSELNSVRAKLQIVQHQLQDCQVEVTLAKQREEAAKGGVLKTQAQLNLARQEADRLSSQLQELRSLREQTAKNDDGKVNSEALLRRLENEKQYLKNQLSSEITLKNELQAALASCQHQLSDMSSQWKSDVDDLQLIAAEAKRSGAEKEATLLQAAALQQVLSDFVRI